MTKVLLSTPCQPYPTEAWNDSLTDLMAQRFTKGQDIFTMTGHMHCHGSHLIAQNISAPVIFLEYPTWEGFEEEVRKGYDFVGISFFPTCMNIVLDMCKMVRRISPSSQIVLGHYGALAFDAAFSEDAKKEYADHVCIGEGVQFFRRLLGEPMDAPIHQSHLPRCGNNLPWLDANPKGNVGFTVAGLGCPSGCDFCSTTQMHGNQRIRLSTTREVFEEIRRYWRDDPNTQQVIVYDEDFIKYKDEVLELCKHIEEDEEFGPKLNWFTTASIEGLCQYDFDDLARGGLGGVFIGVESKFAPDTGYQKRLGDAREVFAGLLQRGVSIAAGWMCGFDFHDRVNVFDDLDYFVALEPTSHQLTKVTAFPGTPLWERMKEEGRMHENIPWEDVNFYGGGFKHKNFEDHEIMEIILYGYRKIYETHGPTLMRQFKLELNGYEHACSKGPDRVWERRAARHRDTCQQMYPLLRVCEHFAPNGIVRRKLRQQDERYRRNFGEPSTAQKVQSAYILAKGFQEKARESLDPRNRHPKEEPFKKYIYDKKNGNGSSQRAPYRVVYPQESLSFTLDRGWNEFKIGLFDKVLGVLDKVDERRGVHTGSSSSMSRIKTFL